MEKQFLTLVKRPAVWIIIVLASLLLAAGIALLANPLIKDEAPRQELPSYVNITTVSGIPLTNHDITDETDQRFIQSILALCDNSGAIWTGKPVDEMADKTQMSVRQTLDKAYTQYTLYFDDTESAYLIADQSGYFCQLDGTQKSALLELVRAGFHTKPVMTVRSGDKTITALGHWVYSYDKITKISADGRYLTAENIKPYLTWLPIDFAKGVKDSTQAFAAYVNGRERYGDFILYDNQLNRIDTIKTSELASQQDMLSSLAPGHYVVELMTSTDALISESGYQYFFGVIIE